MKTTYKVTLLPSRRVIEVSPDDYPYQEDGQPGSILDICLGHGVRLEHACGGNCACTTCHVIVHEGTDKLSPLDDQEADRLDTAEGLTLSSRLGCCAVVRGDVCVEIPNTNRNFDVSRLPGQRQ